VVLILWLFPRRAELDRNRSVDLVHRFCGRWQLHRLLLPLWPPSHGVCFFGDFIFEPWASVAVWDWSKPIAWLGLHRPDVCRAELGACTIVFEAMTQRAARQLLIEIARRDVGQREVSNRAPWIKKLWPVTSYPLGYEERAPYCAAGMVWVLKTWIEELRNRGELVNTLGMTGAQAEKWRCKLAGCLGLDGLGQGEERGDVLRACASRAG